MPPNNARWEDGKLARAANATKSFLKRFGPLILTGLAAVAEHHWLDHKDEREEGKTARERDEPDNKDSRQSVRKLEHEVAELKRSLSRQVNNDEGVRDARPSLRIREEIVREWRPPYQEQREGRSARGRAPTDERPQPIFYQQYQQGEHGGDAGRSRAPIDERPQYVAYQQFPARQQMQTPREVIEDQAVHTREYVRPSRRHHSLQRRRRRHRHSSVPVRSSHENEFSDEAVQAGRVAALAGFAEALHVGDIRGDWIGPKGVRVGTTMAASYAASRSRDRNPDNVKRHEVIADVGTGLLVSRLVHGSSRRLEENERLARRGRRWSYCY